MKLKRIKRWKLKQKHFNQKYKLRNTKKSSKLQDYKGKVLFLVSGKNLVTILKFITKNSCTTEKALIVDDNFMRQLSKKVLLTSRRFKKLMKNCEVMVTKEYKESLLNLITNESNSSQMNALRCETCDAFFISQKALDHHIETNHEMESENETGSEVEVESDDEEEEEEEEEFSPLQPNVILKEYDTSLNSTTQNESLPGWTFLREEQKPAFKCRVCSMELATRGFLNRHVIGLHIPSVYRCYKCKVVYEHKQRLVNHLTMAHLQCGMEEKFKATLCDPEDFSVFHCAFCKYASQERDPVVEHMLNEHYEEFDMESSDNNSSRPSTPDSLEDMLLPENRAQLFGFSSAPIKKRSSSPQLPFRCARCKRQFQRKYMLKDHMCLERPNDDDDEPPAKLLKSNQNAVNGFFHCTFPRCSQVYTNKEMFDTHLAIDHSQPKMK